jgi:hypothetical protein
MTLGAYTPRTDATWGVEIGPPAQESDRLNARTGVPDDDIASKRSSYDPATQEAS